MTDQDRLNIKTLNDHKVKVTDQKGRLKVIDFHKAKLQKKALFGSGAWEDRLVVNDKFYRKEFFRDKIWAQYAGKGYVRPIISPPQAPSHILHNAKIGENSSSKNRMVEGNGQKCLALNLVRDSKSTQYLIEKTPTKNKGPDQQRSNQPMTASRGIIRINLCKDLNNKTTANIYNLKTLILDILR